MSLDKNKQQSPSHSLPLPLLPLPSLSVCAAAYPVAPPQRFHFRCKQIFSHDPVEYVDLLLSALVCEVR